MAVTGVDATTQTIEVFNATNFSAAQWSFKTWAATDVLAIFGTTGADTIVGSSRNDMIKGTGGADALDGASGSDTYAFDILEVSPGLVIHDTGKSGIDTISVEGGFPFDFTGALVSGIEALELATSATFNADQLPAHLSVSGSGLVIQNATHFSAALWVFAAPSSVSISGTNIADTITGSTQNDLISGANGNDLLLGGLGNDSLDGGDDIDTASYRDGAAGVTVSLTLSGAQNTIGAGIDTLANIENLIGSMKADHLTGDGNANVLTGLRGKDIITGDLGADIFDFNVKTESVKGASRDVIMDFSGINVPSGDLDRVDLWGIDAKKGHGNQAFHWIGAHKFHHKAGELHVLNKGAFFLVEGDIDGNGKADFQIEVQSAAALAKGDFIF